MDFGRGISYIRNDPNWLVKVLLGSLISFIPILQFAAVGYAMDTLRNVYMGRETPLPEWGENFGDKFVRGLLSVVILFIYLIPFFVLTCIVAGISGFGTAELAETGAQAGPPIAVLCLLPLILVAELALIAMGYHGVARYAISNNFSDALRFGEVFTEFRNSIGRWLGMLLWTILAGIAFLLVSMVTCGLGFLLSFYLTLAQFHWMAQLQRQASSDVSPSYGA